MSERHTCEVCGAVPANKIGGNPWLCDAHFWARMNEGLAAIVEKANRLPAPEDVVASLRAENARLAAAAATIDAVAHANAERARLGDEMLAASRAEAEGLATALRGLPCMFVWRDRRAGSIRLACDDAGAYADEPIPEHAWCPTCRARALARSDGGTDK